MSIRFEQFDPSAPRGFSRQRGTHRPAAAALLWLAALQPAAAIDEGTLKIAAIEGRGWRLDDIALQLAFDGSRPGAVLDIARLAISDPAAVELAAIRLRCPGLELTADLIACADGRAEAVLPQLGERDFGVSFALRRRAGSVTARFSGLEIDGGTVDADFWLTRDGWRLALNSTVLDVGAALGLLSELTGRPLPDAHGRTALALQIDDRRRGTLVLDFEDVAYSNSEGTLASEALGGRLQLDFDQAGEVVAALALHTGQAYAEPYFIDLAVHPLELAARGRRTTGSPTPVIEVEQLRLDGRDLARVSGQLALAEGETLAIVRGAIDIEAGELAGIYPVLLQPALVGTPLDELETRGAVSGRIEFAAGAATSIELELDGLSATDQRTRFVIDELGGKLCWRAAASCRTALAVAGGSLYGLPFGAAELEARLGGLGGELAAPLRIPILDGAVRIAMLAVDGYGTDAFSLRFDAELEPIDLPSLATALGWTYRPAGTLAGKLPRLSYENEELAIAGTLQAQVFGGTIDVRNFRVSEPFGRLPRLNADLEFQALDLQTVTDTFQFGDITGRLAGHVRGLRLLQWSPIAFDARLATPADDRSRHRISQRAIENLSSIGGGRGQVAAALSSGFLRFFKSFSYERIGIECRLEDDVCLMSGIEPIDERRYYIVKGRGLPRIDVIGEGRRVSWSTLVERIQRIADFDQAVVD